MLTYRYAYAGASIGMLTCGCDGRYFSVKVFLRNVADGMFIVVYCKSEGELVEQSVCVCCCRCLAVTTEMVDDFL
jgi:hypothetical protein